MPTIPAAMLDCVTYLYRSVEAATGGEGLGGTGFLLGVAQDAPLSQWDQWGQRRTVWDIDTHVNTYPAPPLALLYVVTAKHVVVDGFQVVRLTTTPGPNKEPRQSFTLDLSDATWFSNGDDVALCGIGLTSEYPQFSWVPEDFLLSEEDARDTVGPGDEVLFMGRFVNHEGRQRNMPSVRFGNVAMVPEEPIMNELTGHAQETYLCEVRSFPGYSGAPVFAYRASASVNFSDMRMHGKTDVKVDLISDPLLLGIVWAYLPAILPLEDENDRPVGKLHVAGHSGMAGVVPSWKLADLIYGQGELVAVRKKRIEEFKKGAPARLASRKDAEPEQAFTKDDFEAALLKATKRVNPPKERS